MNRFKFDSSSEQRRSLQQAQRTEQLIMIGTLDRCTQILREDRIWLRGQVKANDEHVIGLFKQFCKPSQIQQLQIKLRKYVHGVKAQQKTQQLNRFKQNLSIGIDFFKSDEQSKRTTSHGPLREKSKQNLSMVNKYYKMSTAEAYRAKNQSYDRHVDLPVPSPNSPTTNIKNFQQMLNKHKYGGQEVIEERQSENVTSARQRRYEAPRENYLASTQNLNVKKPHYESQELPRSTTKEETRYGGQNVSKQNLKSLQPQIGSEQSSRNISSSWNEMGLPSRQDRSHTQSQFHQSQSQQQSEDGSIFHQHFNDQLVSSIYNEDQKSSIPEVKQCNTGKQYKMFTDLPAWKNEPWNVAKSMKLEVLQPFQQVSIEKSAQLKQSACSQSFPESIVKSAVCFEPSNAFNFEPMKGSNEGIFTSSELLNQCRKFLKNRESSMKKSMIPEDSTHFPVALSFNLNESKECLYSRSMHNEQELLIKEEETKATPMEAASYNQQSYQPYALNTYESKGYPIKSYQSYEPSVYEPSEYSQMNFEQETPQQKRAEPVPPLANTKNANELTFKSSPAKAYDYSSVESFMEELLEITNQNPFISSNILFEKLAFVPTYFKLLQDLRASKEEICLADIAERLCPRGYKFTHNSTEDICTLLDVYQKGYITEGDVEAFLDQIQQAEVENIDDISQQLWRVFESADYKETGKIGYWHLFLLKHTDSFTHLCQLLGEFEFEILSS